MACCWTTSSIKQWPINDPLSFIYPIWIEIWNYLFKKINYSEMIFHLIFDTGNVIIGVNGWPALPTYKWPLNDCLIIFGPKKHFFWNVTSGTIKNNACRVIYWSLILRRSWLQAIWIYENSFTVSKNDFRIIYWSLILRRGFLQATWEQF